ncbi:MAG: TlpA family protein disulfide reductase [Phycisphaerae bacterium]|nr:TlpA family protein disulfide reductase [Phycisphaerae bacterium]
MLSLLVPLICAVVASVSRAEGVQEADLVAEIRELMRDPAPGGADEDYMSVLADRRKKVISRIEALLRSHPRTPSRDEMLAAKLESLYIVATLDAQDLSRLQVEADRVLAGKPSASLAAYAAYLKMQAGIIAHRQRLRRQSLAASRAASRATTATTTTTTSAPTTTQAPAPDRFVIGEYRSFVATYPKSRFAPGLMGRLIEDAVTRGDRAGAERYLAKLRQDHPRHVETERQSAAERARSAVGKPFSLRAKTTTGQTVDVQDLRGHVVVVYFWASYCPHCRESIVRLQSMLERLASRGLRMIGVSLDESRTSLDAFTSSRGIRWPQCFSGKAWDDDVARRYGVQAIPSAYVVDGEGILRAIRQEDVESVVMTLLAERPDSRPAARE